MTDQHDLPLSGVRILDAAEDGFQMVGRYVADLGADVLRLEPPEGSADRRSGVTDHGVSITFELANANKRSVAVDPDHPSAQQQIDDLLDGADIVLVSRPSVFAPYLDPERIAATHPAVVVTVLTDFGEESSRRDWASTPAVQFALSSILSRSGLPDRDEPLLPPSFLVAGAIAPQAVWQAVTAHYNARRTGTGDIIDFSALDALVHIFDPPLGMQGSGRTGIDPFDVPRGRPDARGLYPIFSTADGIVRICVLSPRQWRNMLTWMGDPPEFSTPEFDNPFHRLQHRDEIFAHYRRHFAALTTEEAVRQGEELRVPVTSIDELGEVVNQPAFRVNGSFTDLMLSDGRTATVPAGVFSIDGARAGLRTPAPVVGDATGWLGHRGTGPVTPGHAGGWVSGVNAHPDRPFEGLRVLDFGVIVMGAETGRLFADYGADVIKVESTSFPDGCRQMAPGTEMSESFAWGHRNKRSLGLDLTSDEGKSVLRQLIAESDVLLTNFKPGTLARLGFGHDQLATINPGLILSESSAYGAVGPWSTKMGYGPLVRAAAGLSALWCYPGDADGYSDTITIYPDHVVARLNAAAVVALLLRRTRTGRGGVVTTAQVDAIFAAMGDHLAVESLEPGAGTTTMKPADAPSGVFPAAGDDEWLVVDVAGDGHFLALATATGHPDWAEDPRFATAAGRLSHSAELERGLRDWTVTQTAPAAEAVLQQAGVPAAHMVRFEEVMTDPDFTDRGLLTTITQAPFTDPFPTLANEGCSRNLGDARISPAPLQGEHTRDLMREILHLDDSTIDLLIDHGVLETHPSTDPVTDQITVTEGAAS